LRHYAERCTTEHSRFPQKSRRYKRLLQALAPSNAPATPRTLIDVQLDPMPKPVAAARHF
jgi:hypothetical protein